MHVHAPTLDILQPGLEYATRELNKTVNAVHQHQLLIMMLIQVSLTAVINRLSE